MPEHETLDSKSGTFMPENETVSADRYTRDTVTEVFTYSPPQEHDVLVYQNLREMAKRFGIFIVEHCPDSEDRNEAINKLREVIFWANSSIALRESKRG